ncbi:T9SS type A sorting domain-containing protein [candidate division KSB1 bacterium]|nr:T9SS type A sorting domain-containing protein [candidate division KSB1 bacterium]
MRNLITKCRSLCLVQLLLLTSALPAMITIHQPQSQEIVVIADSQFHQDYGLAYPLTYQFSLPADRTRSLAYYRYSVQEPWSPLPIRTAADFFNGCATVRFDATQHQAYISVGFGATTDSILIQITDSSGQKLDLTFEQICPYYDNRDAAVTCSADDMAGWSRKKFEKALYIFRQHQLWVSCGINTAGCDATAYRFIQAELDSGYVEASAHSRTHPDPKPYKNYESEITGCKSDIIRFLKLPSLFCNGPREYVYAWIAPHGYTDAVVDSLVSQNKFLVNRMYFSGFEGFANWDARLAMYEPIGVTRAIDPPASRLGWGIGTDDLNDLNQAFDQVLANRSVYHVMCHPNVVEWTQVYPEAHLRHISGRPNIWYVSLGHLYLYHLAQTNYQRPTQVATSKPRLPVRAALSQNFPNPFNATTTIRYTLIQTDFVTLKIFNELGQAITELTAAQQPAGTYQFHWNADGCSSGIYFYHLQIGDRREVRKMLFLK